MTLTNSERVQLKVQALKAGLPPNLTDEQLVAIRDGKPLVSTSAAAEADAVAQTAASQVLEVVRAAIQQELQTAAAALKVDTDAALRTVEASRISIDATLRDAATDARHATTRAATALTDQVERWRNDAAVDLNAAKAKAEQAAAEAEARAEELRQRLASVDALITTAVTEGFEELRSAVIADPQAKARVIDIVSQPRVVRTSDAKSVFGTSIKGEDGTEVKVEIWNHPDTPAIDPDYIFDREALRYALIAQNEASSGKPTLGGNVWLAGERGTGKTQFASQFAARTGRKLVRINFDRHLERIDFIGSKGLVNGNTVWQDGTFLQAFKVPGTVLLLDEFGFSNPANVSNLQALLEPSASVTYEGFAHSRATGVVIFAADNSNGSGDSAGRYAGVQEQSIALLDRFPYTVTLEFLSQKRETDLIVKKTGIDEQRAGEIVALIREARAKTVTGDVVEAPSLRQAFALAVALKSGAPFKSAWTAAVVAKACEESRVALLAIGEAFWTTKPEDNNGNGEAE